MVLENIRCFVFGPFTLLSVLFLVGWNLLRLAVPEAGRS